MISDLWCLALQLGITSKFTVSKPFKMSAENLIDAISMKHIVDLLFVQLNFRIWQGNRTKNKKRVKKRGIVKLSSTH